MKRNEIGVTPLKRLDGEPVFDEPWQAQVLAMADALIAGGVIAPTNWSDALGAALAKMAARGEPDNAETYYTAALSALEQVAEAQGGITGAQVAVTRDAWEAAYRATPHGRPVRLADR